MSNGDELPIKVRTKATIKKAYMDYKLKAL